MRRYVVAGVIQAMPAVLVCAAIVWSGALGSGSLSNMLPLCGVVAISAASAALAFKARTNARMGTIFVLVETVWVAIYVAALAKAHLDAQRAFMLLRNYQGSDPILRMTLGLSVAASQTGAGIVESLEKMLLALHVLCLGLGLWGRLGRGCASSPGVDAPMS